MTAQELIATALEHHQRGNLAEAERIYRQVLSQDPQNVDALHLLGVIAHQVGRHADAIALIERAVALVPQAHDFHVNLGEAYRGAGDMSRAIASYQRAAALRPELADDHSRLGSAFARAGLHDESIAAFRRAIELRPGDAVARLNLSNVFVSKRMHAEAEQALREAIELRPDFADAHNNLGDLYLTTGRAAEAEAPLRAAIRHNPALAEPHNNLAGVLRARGDLDGAIDELKIAIGLRPNYANAYCGLSAVLTPLKRADEAVAAARRAIELQPNFPEAFVNLANALISLERLDEAEAACREAIRLKPDLFAAHVNLGNVLRETGAVDEAIAAFRTAADLHPDDPRAAGNLVYTLLFDPAYDSRAVFIETKSWSDRYARRLAASMRPVDIDRSPTRRLRVGYVSPDFRSHSSSFFVTPLLESHDRNVVEVCCYSIGGAPDATTDRMRRAADVWRDLPGADDARLADAIRSDHIDIAIDLGMQLANNRLLTFARKPAPIQAAWLAYPGTTGLDTMDYRITDWHLDPADRDVTIYSEKCVRLPDSWACFDPLNDDPAVNATPALQNGFVTFGSLNSFVKMNPRVVELWARALARISDWRLLLYSPPGKHRSRYLDLFDRAGVAADCIEFVGRVRRADYMQTYQRIDICLDPFPHSGMTTTCEALWMGVPVLTLPGTSAPSRGALTFLATAGLDDLAAHDSGDFVRVATELASDVHRLNALRQSLRERLRKSAVMDATRFARNMERAYRLMWERFCRSEPAAELSIR